MIGILLNLALLFGHPIHTTVLELAWNPHTQVVQGTLRVFEDDLLAASRSAGVGATEYVLRRFRVLSEGQTVRVTACGERRAADAVLICIRGSTRQLRHLRIHDSILTDRHPDQVNIVRLDGACTATLLFTRETPEQATNCPV